MQACAQVGKRMHDGGINLGFLDSFLNNENVSIVTELFKHSMQQIRINQEASAMILICHSATSASRKRSA